MPSLNHEGFVRLFLNRPALAVELVRDVLGIAVPDYTEIHIDTADLTDIEPAARYADLVVDLRRNGGKVLAIVIEVQLEIDRDKLFSWPVYLTNLRARLRCAVELLVVTPSARVARWAAQPIRIGQGALVPLVLGPDAIPVVTDPEIARADPELAVLSALAHGRGPVDRARAIALAALAGCAAIAGDQALVYSDVILVAMSEAARAALEEMMRTEPYKFKSEFALRHQAEGKAKGKAEGKAEAVLSVLDARGLEIADEQRDRILGSRDPAELERWLRRAATAAAASELFE